MDLLSLYGLFLAKVVTVVIAIGALVVLLVGLRQRKSHGKGELQLIDLGEQYREMQREMRHARMNPAELKIHSKQLKKRTKRRKNRKNCRPKPGVRKANPACMYSISKAVWMPTK